MLLSEVCCLLSDIHHYLPWNLSQTLYYAPILGYTGTISETQLEEFNAQGKNYISSDVVGKAGLESAYADKCYNGLR